MRQITEAEGLQESLATLGLGRLSGDPTSAVVLAALLRREAGYLCPCPKRTLVEAAADLLRGFVAADKLRGLLGETVEAMVAYGDLTEERELGGQLYGPASRLLYLVPPAFVRRKSGAVLLVGIAPDDRSPLPTELDDRVEYHRQVRLLPSWAGADLPTRLRGRGLIERTDGEWLRCPPEEAAQHYKARFDRSLASTSERITGLRILNHERPVRYYKGRWKDVQSQTGRFIGRRPQAYGNDLWCYVELDHGWVKGMCDLPLVGQQDRGCDEAWRLQMAIDRILHHPQQVRVRAGVDEGQRILDFFSPIPAWAERRLTFFAQPVAPKGCLLSFSLPQAEIAEEIQFFEKMLWLQPVSDEAPRVREDNVAHN